MIGDSETCCWHYDGNSETCCWHYTESSGLQTIQQGTSNGHQGVRARGHEGMRYEGIRALRLQMTFAHDTAA